MYDNDQAISKATINYNLKYASILASLLAQFLLSVAHA